MTEQTSTRYHHGELPATLIRLALQHINDEGTDKLSLRALARDAGVSPTAPYSHFPTKMCLLAAIATLGFDQLRGQLENAASASANSEDRLLNIGLAYINFATHHPTEYKLMFGSVIIDFSRYPMLLQSSEAAYCIVQRCVSDVIKASDMTADEDLLNASLWGLVHGISSLLIDKANIDMPESSPMQSVQALAENPEAALRLMMKGFFKH